MHSAENKKNRICIFILGMHRSGTSATSGCLNLLGYQLGKQLVPAGEPNEKGYFENDSINRFNEGLLDILSARWHDTLYLPDEWWMDGRVKTKHAELAKILLEEFGPDSDFIIKDPRISVLLPVYLDVFNKLNISARVIINFRNPLEVAASLKKRDNLSLSKSLLLWMDANLKAEQFTRSFPRLFLDYNSLLNDPVFTLQQIIKALQLDVEINGEIKTALNSFIEKSLKHHAAKPATENLEIPELVYQLAALLQQVDFRNAEHREQELFDGISQHFYSGFRFFNGIDEAFQVVLKTIDDNSKSKVYSAPAHPGLNKIRFLPDRSSPVAEFLIYPINRRAALQLLNLKVKTTIGEYLPVEITESNAEKVLDNGLMIFESEFPWLRIKLEKPTVLSQINCEFQFLAFSAFTYRLSIQERNLYESELLSKIVQLQTENVNLIAAHGVAAEKLKSEVGHLQTENSNLIAAHKITVANLEHEITNLQKENDNLIAVHGVAAEKLKSEIGHLQTENSNLISAHEITVTNLEIKIINLQKENDKLIVDHRAVVKKLENKRSKLESEYLARLNKFEAEHAKLSEELRFNQEQLQLLMDSGSWKIGRSVTWPYRILKEKYKNNYEK